MITHFLEVSVGLREQSVPLKDRQILDVHVALSAYLLPNGELPLLLDREPGTESALILWRHVVESESITGMLLRFCDDHGLVDDVIGVDEHLRLVVEVISLALRRRVRL